VNSVVALGSADKGLQRRRGVGYTWNRKALKGEGKRAPPSGLPKMIQVRKPVVK